MGKAIFHGPCTFVLSVPRAQGPDCCSHMPFLRVVFTESGVLQLYKVRQFASELLGEEKN